MRQLIVKFRPGSHQGSFGQLSVKKGLLSVITTRFLMRSVLLKFLKFWKFWGSFKDTEVYGGAGRFWEKNKTLIPELSTPVTWPICDLLLSYWCFPFYYLPFSFQPRAGIIPNAKFSSFSLYTGWDLIKRDPWEFCLIDSVVIIRTYLIVQQVWFVTLIARPTPGQLKVGKKKMIAKLKSRKKQYNKWQEEEWRVLVSLWVGSM